MQLLLTCLKSCWISCPPSRERLTEDWWADPACCPSTNTTANDRESQEEEERLRRDINNEEKKVRWEEGEKQGWVGQKSRVALCLLLVWLRVMLIIRLYSTDLPFYISPAPCTYSLHPNPSYFNLPALSLHLVCSPSLSHFLLRASFTFAFMFSFCCATPLVVYIKPPLATKYYGTVCVITTIEATLQLLPVSLLLTLQHMA